MASLEGSFGKFIDSIGGEKRKKHASEYLGDGSGVRGKGKQGLRAR